MEPDPTDSWLVWQLVDSAFPSGSFAHSNGLEAAWQHGAVTDGPSFAAYLDASLRQCGRAVLPFVLSAHRQPRELPAIDRLCDAFTANPVANRASRQQGHAFLKAVSRIFPDRLPALGQPDAHLESQPAPTCPRPSSRSSPAASRLGLPHPPYGHLAPAYGAALQRLELPATTSARLFLFGHLRALVAAAVRLSLIGPIEAQRIQHRAAPCAQSVLVASEGLTLDDIAQTAPVLDLWQAHHDRLHSRLFQS